MALLLAQGMKCDHEKRKEQYRFHFHHGSRNAMMVLMQIKAP
jgi:hypothetical protein